MEYYQKEYVNTVDGLVITYKKEKNGIPVEDILTSNVVKNLSQDDVNTVIGNMLIYNNTVDL